MMSTQPNLIAAGLFGFMPLWLFAALLHLVEGEVGGVHGLARPDMLVSVTIIAAVLAIPALIPVLGFIKGGKRGYALALLLVSALSVLVIQIRCIGSMKHGTSGLFRLP